MSTCSEGDCSFVFGSLEACGSGDGNIFEAGDVEACSEKLSQLGTVRVSIFEEEGAREWLKKIQAVSKVTWRVLNTFPGGRKNVFKTKYRCQHNVMGKDALTGKNTNCPATLMLTLKRTQLARGGKSRSKDALISTHPLIASLQGGHNHDIESAAALRYRDVSEEVKQHLKDLFAAGHSPSNAYDLLRNRMMASDPERYVFNAADRHYLPDLQFCYSLYYKVYNRGLRGRTTQAAISKDERHMLQFLATGQYAAPPVWFSSLQDSSDPSDAAQAPSCSKILNGSPRSEASYVQHASDEGLQASEEALGDPCPNVEQPADEGAAEENTDELRHTVRQLVEFIEDQATTPGRGKYLMAMLKAVKRLGNGRALERAMLTFGHKTAPSLRATKSSSTIGVQPTAVARRKIALGGRKRVFAGRRCNSQIAGQLLQAAKRKKVRAPHS